MTETLTHAPTFAAAAQRVMWRVWLRRWLALLGQTLWPVTLAMAVAGALILAAGLNRLSQMGWVMIGAWIFGSIATVWRSRPREYSALALWDQVKGRREAFATAWWFEHQPAPLPDTARQHVDAQRAILADALPALRRDLPLQPHRWLWAPPVLALLLTVVNVALRVEPETLIVDEAMSQTARDEARRLAQTDWEKKKLEGLKANEEKALEELKKNLKTTAQSLEQAGGKDARDIMADLERRAREAEKLAERLGADKDAWASEKLVRALRNHADTAELGDSLAAKNAADSAKAAESLAADLKSPQLTNDARERMNETLKDTAESAEKEDRQRVAGQHVLAAGDQLQQRQAEQAGGEFQKLADKMRDLARREQTRKELQRLAEQLRNVGSNIAGQNQAGGMQQMAGAQQQGQAGQSQQVPQASQMGQGQQQQQQTLQPPGLGQMSQGQMQQMSMAPVPGTGQPQKMMLGQGQPGKQGQGQPMLLAPIPGAKPGEQPTALLLGPPGQSSPGGQPMMMMGMQGGKDPGAGTAKLNAEPTAKQSTANQSMVTAQQNNEGPSSVRAVEGGERQEAAARSASQVAVDFIQAEEEALDESALPPSRREQVRRYFTELRRRFEKQ